MAENWTPGPWRVHPDGVLVQAPVAGDTVVFRQYRAVVDCFTSSSGKFSRAECEANARLIAAAPALYNALCELEWSGQAGHPRGGYYDCCLACEGAPPADDRIDAIYRGHTEACPLAEALRLARGEQPTEAPHG